MPAATAIASDGGAASVGTLRGVEGGGVTTGGSPASQPANNATTVLRHARTGRPMTVAGARQIWRVHDIRAGVHTGEVEVRGNDVGGIGVHIAARIAALPGPGEILVSRTVKDLVTGSGITFEDRGTHALKGIPDTWQVYAVEG